MNTKLTLQFATALLLLSTFNSQLSTVHAQGSAFTYQGRLNDGANAANGIYDLRFGIFDAQTIGTQQGALLTNSAVGVTNGLFMVALNLGAGVFTGEDRWLEIAVRTNGADAFTNLASRQQITSTPYAVRAANFSGAVSDAQLSANVARLNANQTFTGAVNFNSASNHFAGNFSGNGAAVAGVPLGLLNTAGAITWGRFAFGSSPGAGTNPNSVVAADVNGDGKLDLIAADNGPATLSVLTNNGSGDFVLASSPDAGGGQTSVIAADVNGDGKVDLIAAIPGNNALSVLTNDGSGGFVLSSSPGTGDAPYLVITADVNGDGKVDLISANPLDDSLTVLTNSGSGGFVLSSSLGVGPFPISVAAADVNGDRRPDLICANENDTTLSVLTNNGSGGFVLSSSPVVGSFPSSVTAADVNGDGMVDLISASLGEDALTVLSNDGSGGFVVSSLPGVGIDPVSVVAADVNGDGMVDLISANYGGFSMSVLTNNGNGGFVLSSTQALSFYPFSVVAADLNGDGQVDLAFAEGPGNALSVWFNQPTINGSFSGSFSGNGFGLTSLNATNLIGKINDTRLSTNVALLHEIQTFTGANTFSSGANSFTGNGSALTSLNAANLASGTVPDARLSTNVTLLNVSQTNTADKTFASGAQLFLDAGSAASPSLSFSGSTNRGIFSPGLNQICLATAGTEWLRVTGSGRVGIGTNAPQSALHVVGTVTATAFNPPSDRNLKENFTLVSPLDVLDKVIALPISRWNFIGDAATPHLGPMAQDFRAAFGLGTDDRHIATVDADGVALSAIQGLNQKVEAENAMLREELKRRDTERAELKQRLDKLEQLINQSNGSAR